MKVDWLSIPPETFEEIVAAIMTAEGYLNVTMRRGGTDSGWDIDASWQMLLPGGQVQLIPCRVECKRHRKSPAPKSVNYHYDRMTDDTSGGFIHILFVSPTKFSNPIKNELRARSKERRVMLEFWEGGDLDKLAARHISHPEVNRLLGEFSTRQLSNESLAKACEIQVRREIDTKVGKKYMPELYRPRSIEGELETFFNTDPDREQVSELRQAIAAEVEGSNSKSTLIRSGDSAEASTHLAKLLSDIATSAVLGASISACTPALEDAFARFSKQKQRRLREILSRCGQAHRRNVFLVRDRAGSGKTNLLANLALSLISSSKGKFLPLFLTCKFSLSDANTVETLVLDQLRDGLVAASGSEARVSNEREALLSLMQGTLKQEGSHLIVFLDGINENRNLRLLDESLIRLFSRWNSFPVKFVVTCRDIFWEFFTTSSWSTFLSAAKVHDLPPFKMEEIEPIVNAYFNAFEIVGRLSGAAKEKCRHPLLLRFLCEAYRGRDIHEVEDVRLHHLFQEYWKRKRTEIATALNVKGIGHIAIERFVLRIANAMSQSKTTSLGLNQIGDLTGESDLESDNSLYKRLLDEDIILEEMPSENSLDHSYLARRISFVYDEFYDYMLAVSFILEKDWSNKPVAGILHDFAQLIKESANFQQLRGVAVYLVLCVEGKYDQNLCQLLGDFGQHDILSNVLPKLKNRQPWMADVLKACLRTIEGLNDAGNQATISKDKGSSSFVGFISKSFRVLDEVHFESNRGPAVAVDLDFVSKQIGGTCYKLWEGDINRLFAICGDWGLCSVGTRRAAAAALSHLSFVPDVLDRCLAELMSGNREKIEQSVSIFSVSLLIVPSSSPNAALIIGRFTKLLKRQPQVAMEIILKLFLFFEPEAKRFIEEVMVQRTIVRTASLEVQQCFQQVLDSASRLKLTSSAEKFRLEMYNQLSKVLSAQSSRG